MESLGDIVCVILAGGKGKRMASTDLHKVCFPIAGRPAILRAIEAYKAAGLQHFLIVVGHSAGQIMATVAPEHPEITYVYQSEAGGTGHAAQVAARALMTQGWSGSVMITMGDKVPRPVVIRHFLDLFRNHTPDLLITTLPKAQESSAGRIVIDRQGRIRGNVERADIRQAQQTGQSILVGGQRLTAEQIEEQSQSVNASMYLFKSAALHEALTHLRRNNVQGELYLTDTIEYLSRHGRVESLLVTDSTEMLTFNTPAELLVIEEILRKEEKPSRIKIKPDRTVSASVGKTAALWLELMKASSPVWRATLSRLYGDDPGVLDERTAAWRSLIESFIAHYGSDRPLVLCRAPGQLNLMGRHIDYCGGMINVMAIDREVIMAAALRKDDVVRLRHGDVQRFPPHEFRITELLHGFSWTDWMDFLASRTVRDVLDSAPGDWSHYARAPLLRLQHECRQMPLSGMDCQVNGNIPMGAGLSSSSALVVAFAEVAIALNGLNVELRDFVDLCGEGEWFAGGRGHAGSHAASRSGQRGTVMQIGFFPFQMMGETPFPDEMAILLAGSGATIQQSHDVRQSRIAAYELARTLWRKQWPVAGGADNLRDMTPDHLRVEPSTLYRALRLLPERVRWSEALEQFNELFRTELEEVSFSPSPSTVIDLRGVALYGLAECVRSNHYGDLLSKGNWARIGQLMQASHDGDRRFRMGKSGHWVRWASDVSDRALATLEKSNAPLDLQGGCYASSTATIDRMVDYVSTLPGVVGVQMAGAGGDGFVMMLVKAAQADAIGTHIQREYYHRRKINGYIHRCRPVAGAGIVVVE